MRRVLIVSHTYVDPDLRGKLRALAARGVELTVAVPQQWKEPAFGRRLDSAWERQSGLEVFPVPATHPGDALRSRFGAREFSALVRDKRPDLLQIEEEPETALARQVADVAHKLRVPLVLGIRANVDRPAPWITGWRRRRLLQRVQGLLAGSMGAAALVRRIAPDVPTAVIPQLGATVPANPVHEPHEGLVLGFVGRLVPPKGLDTLLEALGQIRHERWSLVVAGDGPERERLEHQATTLRLAARIRWTGALPSEQLERIWSQLDVLVTPSRPTPDWNEPVGHALVEAMAHEVAVVGSETGVIPEIVADAGVLVPPGDATALAEVLHDLANQPRRLALAQAARARVMREYSDDAVAERTLAFWESVLQGSTG